MARSTTPDPALGDDAPAPSLAERARTLAASSTDATLATLAHAPAGHPFASAVSVTMDGAAAVLLLSALAEHTKNLASDPRCSLLFTETASPGGESGGRLALGRVTLLGRARSVDAQDRDEFERVRRAYLDAVPEASAWCDFADFAFHVVEPESARMIRGFGSMSWLDAAQWRAAEADPIAGFADGILDHMNADHGDALRDYVWAFAGRLEASAVRMTSIDRYGFEVVATGGGEAEPLRFGFASEIADASEARRELVRLAREARVRLGGS
ncbi:MAG: DUF2470 domain-containing protein [Myxococcales bacterium]|nr:DUF2470 domain-containing protein [Myxococcales bacterium]